ncbi:hypothetical protein Trydic_g15436, partial [Trypoxylus dichotomus]
TRVVAKKIESCSRVFEV